MSSILDIINVEKEQKYNKEIYNKSLHILNRFLDFNDKNMSSTYIDLIFDNYEQKLALHNFCDNLINKEKREIYVSQRIETSYDKIDSTNPNYTIKYILISPKYINTCKL